MSIGSQKIPEAYNSSTLNEHMMPLFSTFKKICFADSRLWRFRASRKYFFTCLDTQINRDNVLIVHGCEFAIPLWKTGVL